MEIFDKILRRVTREARSHPSRLDRHEGARLRLTEMVLRHGRLVPSGFSRVTRLDTFLQANRTDQETSDTVRALSPGESIVLTGGGGAAIRIERLR